MARTPRIPKAFLTPKSPAQKAFVAAEKATKRADNFRDTNAGWRFAGRPHSETTLDQLDADHKALREEAQKKHRTYTDLTGQTRVDRRDPNAPRGPDKGATGLRRRTQDRTPPVPTEPKPEPVDRGPFSPAYLAKFKANADPKGFKSQKERSKQGELDKLELRGAIDRHPVEKPRHPDAAHAEAQHQSMGDQAGRLRARAPQDRKNKSAADTAQFGKDSAPKVPSLGDAMNGLKADSKPGAGDRRTSNPSGLHKLAVAQGWKEKKTKNGWILQSPDGKHQVTYHLSHSDHRATANMLAELQRGGLQVPGRRRGDIKTDVSTGDTGPRRPIPRLPRTGPGTNDVYTGDRTPRIPKQEGTPGYGPGPGGIVLPKPPLPPTGPGTNDQYTGGPPIIPRGNGTIIAKSAGDNGTTSGENRFNHRFPQQDPNKPKVKVEGPSKPVPHKGTTFQKPVEPYVKPTFQPKPPADNSLRHAVIQAKIKAETDRLVERGSKPSPQPPNKPRAERDPNAVPVRRIDWSKHLNRK